MPTIKITSARQPWANGQPQPQGAEIEVSSEDATTLIDNGFAELVGAAETPAPKTTAARRRRTEDEAAL